MDFSLPQVIVVPSDNSVPTTGYPYNLSVGQVGVFKANYSAATSSNVTNEDYIYIAQGRDVNGPLPSDRSDKIAKKKLISYTKVTGSDVVANEIWDVSDFSVSCGEDVSLTLDVHSFYIDTAFFNGLRRSVTVKAPCCDCGSDPCTDVDNDKIIDLLIEKLSEDFSINREAVNLLKYFDFLKIGTGADAILRIVAKALDNPKQTTNDLALNPYMFDRLWFRPYVTRGAETNADFLVFDKCDQVATTELKQKSSYPKLTAEEVKSIEKDYYSYKVPNYKELFRMDGYNYFFKSYVEDDQVYDQYMITFTPTGQSDPWQDELEMDERVILYIPNTITDIQAILAAYLGDPTDESGATTSTTTTTSTSSTSTTTTTLAFP